MASLYWRESLNTMLVQKLGGTSVADPEAIRRLVGIVASARDGEGTGPVVVVSALSGVTDALLTAATEAAKGDATRALTQLEALRLRHLEAVEDLVPGRVDAVMAHLTPIFDGLTSICSGLAALREVSPQTLDVVSSSGELLSSRLVAEALVAAGLPGVWVDPREVIITDDEHMRASVHRADTDAAIQRMVTPLLTAGEIPVMGGYVGATSDGRTTTLGRGGSDYSGALLGAALRAREIQIWTDVDGMMSADPRVISNPRVVSRLSFGEAAELAYFGAKVLHPATIAPAVEHDIPVRILNARRPDGAGTEIAADAARLPGELAALACKRGVTVVDITSTRMLNAYGFLRQVFEVFDRFRTAVDVVTTSEVSVSVTVDDTRHLAAITEALSAFAQVVIQPDMALLCAVGDGAGSRSGGWPACDPDPGWRTARNDLAGGLTT